MGKIIYIKPDEEITSVIDKLVKTKDKEIFLVLPKGAVLGQSAVNLKLLKREVNNLDKKVTIVSQDPALQRLAKKIDFFVSDSLAQETAQAEAADFAKTEEEITLHEPIPEDKFEDLLKEEKKSRPLRIADIVRGGLAPKGNLVIKKAKATEITASPDLDEDVAEIPEKEIGIFKEDTGDGSALSEKNFSDHHYDFLRPKEKKELVDITISRESELSQKSQPDLSKKSFLSSFPGKIFGLFIVSALVIAALASFLFLPKAEVLISAKRQNLPINMKIFVDKKLASVNFEENKIPGQLLRIEEKILAEFEVTGQRQLNEKAKGTITVYNAYSSSPQTLVETTRFLSSDGLIFRLTKTVMIPGAKIEQGQIVPNSIDVLVEADQPGVEYNIGPTNFTIPGFKGSPKYDGFYGKSKSEMSGGSTENVRILTQDDFDQAKAQAWEDLKEKINAQMTAQIPSNFTLLKEAVLIEMTQVQSSVEIGGKAEKFSISLKGIGKAMIFSQENILLLLKNKLISDATDQDFLPKRSFNYENIKAEMEKGLLNFQLKGEQEVFWKINVDELKSLIAGKGEQEVKGIFSDRPEISEAQFSLWPFWAKKIPAQKEKIEITID